MTLSTQTSKTSFSGNGVTCVFPLPFPFARDADIRALLLDGGLETPLALGTHYTLTGAGGASGGSLSMLAPPATGRTLVIWRAPAIVQEVDYVENSAFPAETHEAALDLLTMICQSLQEQVDRAVLYPVSTPAEDILDSAEFLEATTANRAAAQLAQVGAEAAQAAAQAARDAAQDHAAGAAQSAAAAAQSAQEAAQTVTNGMPDASLATKGAVLLASAAEVAAGTDAAKAVTPAALKPALDAKLDASDFTLATLGAAASGANSDITEISGLTTPLSVAQGGTGRTTAVSDSSALSVMYTLLYCRSQSRASGPVPYGYLFPLITDELATKTGAGYDSTAKCYYNGGGTAAVTLTSGLLSKSTNIGDWNAAQLVDNGTGTTGFTAGSAGTSDYVQLTLGTAKNLVRLDLYVDGSTSAQWYVQYYNGSTWVTAATINMSGGAGWKTISWTGPGAYTQWRIAPVSAPGAGPNYTELKVYEFSTGSVTVTAAQSSSTGSFTFYTDIDDLWDGDTASCFYTASSGATVNIDFGAGSAQALNKWTVVHSGTTRIATWTGAGAHRYWRLRFTSEMGNGVVTVAWIIEYSDDGTAWTAASTAQSYTANSVVVSCAVEAQGDMTLIPAAVTAGAHPDSMTVRFLHKAIDAVTYGTDLKLRVSTDGGTTWSDYGSIAKLCSYDADYDLLEATFDTLALTGVSLKPEVSTANTKSQKVAGIAISYT